MFSSIRVSTGKLELAICVVFLMQGLMYSRYFTQFSKLSGIDQIIIVME